MSELFKIIPQSIEEANTIFSAASAGVGATQRASFWSNLYLDFSASATNPSNVVYDELTGLYYIIVPEVNNG